MKNRRNFIKIINEYLGNIVKRKKNILLSFIIMISLFLIVFSNEIHARENYDYKSVIENILTSECEKYQVNNVQELIDEVFSYNSINGTTQTFIMSIYTYDIWNTDIELDYSKYIKAVEEEIKTMQDMSVFQLQKTSITLNILGVDNQITQYALDNTIGERGIMSYIVGLDLLNVSQVTSNEVSTEEVVDTILSYQLKDGGFTNSGKVGDADVTAMTLQALAKYYEEDEKVKDCVVKALEFLSKEQLEAGDFASYGEPCSEGVAQVLIAMDTLGIGIEDSRFVKNNNTAIDGLLKYKVTNGGISHIADGKFNEMASAQALEAFVKQADNVEYISKNGSDGLFNKSFIEKIPLKFLLVILICIIGSLYIIVKTRKEKKKIFSTLVVMLAAIVFVLFSNIQSNNEFTRENKNVDSSKIINVSIEIRCDSIIGKTAINKKKDVTNYIPEDGIILDIIDYEVSNGDTVLELLQSVCKEKEIPLECEGNEKLGYSYVEGILYLNELDYGDLSGWMYQVNGEFLDVGCGEYQLQDGDAVEWIYSCELGRDIGDEWNK